MLNNPIVPVCSSTFLIAILAMAACTTMGNRDASAPFADKEWRLVELNGRPALTTGTANDPFLRFAVDSGRVTGNTGCNLLTGPFTHGGESLKFGALVTTKRACTEEERNRQEVDFSAALSATQRYAVSRDTMTLFGADGPLARLVAREPVIR